MIGPPRPIHLSGKRVSKISRTLREKCTGVSSCWKMSVSCKRRGTSSKRPGSSFSRKSAFLHADAVEESMDRSEKYIRDENNAEDFLIHKNIYHSVCNYSCPHIYRPAILETCLTNCMRILFVP